MDVKSRDTKKVDLSKKKNFIIGNYVQVFYIDLALGLCYEVCTVGTNIRHIVKNKICREAASIIRRKERIPTNIGD